MATGPTADGPSESVERARGALTVLRGAEPATIANPRPLSDYSRMLRRFVVALLVMGAITFAPAVRGGEDRPFDLHELRLANGLRVVTDHNPRVPTVSVVVRYDVGTSMDPVGRAGLAELTMWLMARRSQHVREGDFVAQLERAGATWQYNSYEDAIIFSAEVPINALELAFWLLSDQMGFFVPALDQAAIDDRRTMMKNERATMANRKGALAEKLARDELYPEGHPYRQTIASPDDIQLGGVTVKEVEAFAKRWFVPSNAVLVVAGDVTRDQVAGLANKYFAPIEGGAAPPHVVPPPVTLAGQTVLEVAAPVQLTTVTVDWPTPRHYAPGDADLDVVAG